MNILIFGPPGSGKGTQAEHICDAYRFIHVSTGDIIRKEIHDKTAIGKKAKDIISQGKLLDDKTIIEMIAHHINHRKILFDGFPRTLAQAKALDKIITVDAVIFLRVTDKEVIRRISQRWMVELSHKQYTFMNKKKAEEFVKYKGGRLFHREDDSPKIIKERLKEYKKLTEPILHHYRRKVYEIHGEKTIKNVWHDIEKILKKISH